MHLGKFSIKILNVKLLFSFSEDDDEDDLDFTVHDRFGNKKPTTKKLKHKHHRSLTKGITKSRNSNSFNAADNEITEVSQLDNNKEAVGVKKRFNKPPKKLLNVSAGSSGVVVNTGSVRK